MLVLTRKVNQAIVIRDDIEVRVVAILGDTVRLGIHTPRDIPVLRREIYVRGPVQRVEGDAAVPSTSPV